MKAKSKSMCEGCRNNFYNGNNPFGVQSCWYFSDAKVVRRKKVPLSQQPPWKQPPIEVLDCRREQGYVFIDAKREN